MSREESMSRRIGLAIKRALDIVVSLTALTLLSPLMALIALAIKLNDGGPVLYVQDRVGKDGQVFRCYKFRTPGLSSVEGMVVGAENKSLGLEVAKDDPRITRVGRFLRHWTLDKRIWFRCFYLLFSLFALANGLMYHYIW
jgi:lipopolysaccharide/colanic/teichoic acid biosynthesis glycosyltransferase